MRARTNLPWWATCWWPGPSALVMTVGGAAVWLVSLPFTLLAGHASEAAETLMLGPARRLSCAAWVVAIPVIPTRTAREREKARKQAAEEVLSASES